MSNTACATLYLLGAYLTEDGNNYGRVTTASRNEMEWYNINLRTLLGDLYDKYDTFNLCLTSISCGTPSEALGVNYLNNDVDNGHLTVYVSGLPFINQTYSQISRGNVNEVPIGVFTYPITTTTVGYRVYNDSGIATFGKSQEQCTLRITMRRVYDDDPPDTINFLPITNFLFSIVGVKESEKKNILKI
jgi:hypothetical protein